MTLPPRARLAQVLESLAARLPEQLGELLEAERFDDGARALLTVARADADALLAAGIPDDEATWLSERLLQRWADVGSVALDPAVAIRCPDDVWVARRHVALKVEAASDGIEDGWRAEWGPPADPVDEGRSASLHIEPIDGSATRTIRLRVKLWGRSAAGRDIWTAHHTLRVRRPMLTLDERRQRLLVRDQTGAPASRVRVQIGDQLYSASDAGLIELDTPLPVGTRTKVTLRLEQGPLTIGLDG